MRSHVQRQTVRNSKCFPANLTGVWLKKENKVSKTNSLNQRNVVPLESTIPFHPYESVRVSLSRVALQILYCNIGMRTEDECFVAQLWFVSG